MIHYININKKRLVGRNNQPNTLPLILDFHTLGNIQFCLIDDKNQIRALPENSALTFAGSVKMGEISQNILFLSTTYTVSEDNVINFTVDTYTEPFLTQIKKKNTEINVEISIKFEDGHQKLLLRDYAYACPRVYIEGVPPTPVEYYYTKDEVDSLINSVKADIPTKTSELINDSGYITSSQIDLSDYYTKEETDNKLDEKADKTAIPTKTSELTNDSGFITSSQIDFSDYYTKEETNTKLSEKADLSSLADYQPVSGMANYALKSDIPSGGSGGGYTFPYETRTFLCAAESVEADGTILIQKVSSNLYTQSGNRQINNVVVIPSGAPSGKVDFVYEEVSGFVYNPFTTFQFQLDCIPFANEMPTLQDIQLLVDRNNNETIIATTEGSDDLQRYSGQNENSLYGSQVIRIKNILANEFKSVAGDKMTLRFIFAYQYFGTNNQRKAPKDQKMTFYVMRDPTSNGMYSFYLAVNHEFENKNLPSDKVKYNLNPYDNNNVRIYV